MNEQKNRKEHMLPSNYSIKQIIMQPQTTKDNQLMTGSGVVRITSRGGRGIIYGPFTVMFQLAVGTTQNVHRASVFQRRHWGRRALLWSCP